MISPGLEPGTTTAYLYPGVSFEVFFTCMSGIGVGGLGNFSRATDGEAIEKELVEMWLWILLVLGHIDYQSDLSILTLATAVVPGDYQPDKYYKRRAQWTHGHQLQTDTTHLYGRSPTTDSAYYSKH
ncbi:hypothetical protein P167DRAFT_549062 [Morchella conica CCBAS932]|uniref:Uncharacterized protein n=1 Tax=Morchella conica CCBAS932 TaxID=1392247 RepID=A0A3N4KFQ7_9PEZI|nr:hypothetical protein P167DRAFT_549062 [Morchella conica CCBAS932]